MTWGEIVIFLPLDFNQHFYFAVYCDVDNSLWLEFFLCLDEGNFIKAVMIHEEFLGGEFNFNAN